MELEKCPYRQQRGSWRVARPRSRDAPARQIERAAAVRCGVVRGSVRGETPVVFSVVESNTVHVVVSVGVVIHVVTL